MQHNYRCNRDSRGSSCCRSFLVSCGWISPFWKEKKSCCPCCPSQILSDEFTGIVPSESAREEDKEHDQFQIVYQAHEKDYSPEVTIQKHKLKHGPEQCFCGKSGLNTQEDKDKYFKIAHFQKGRGINLKTEKKKIYGPVVAAKKPAKITVQSGSISGSNTWICTFTIVL